MYRSRPSRRSLELDVLHGYLPYAIVTATASLSLAMRMYFKKRADNIAARRCPPDKLPELMRAMRGLPEEYVIVSLPDPGPLPIILPGRPDAADADGEPTAIEADAGPGSIGLSRSPGAGALHAGDAVAVGFHREQPGGSLKLHPVPVACWLHAGDLDCIGSDFQAPG